MLLLFYLPMLKNGDESIYFTVTMVICISAVADVGMYKAIQKMAEKRMTDEQVRFLELQLALQAQHYESYGELEDKLRHLRHDVGNQLQVIKTLITQKSYKEAEEMSEGLEKYLEGIKSMNYCGNKIVNALLSSK